MLEQMEAVIPVLISTSRTFDLGQHILEVLEDQSVLLVDQETGTETMQLDAQEGYRLLVVLQSVFATELSV